MTKTINKILALTFALCMTLGLASIASAAEIGNSGGSGSTPVNLTTTADGSLDGPIAPTAMSVTVPTALPMAMAQDGSVTTASNCKITNNSYGAVRVASVTITAGPNWNLTAFGDKSTLAGQKVDSNQLGFAMSIGGGAMVCTDSGNTNSYNDKSQADIPMQRKACHRFAEQMGWTIIHEEQEDGVSGHKVRAENRDKVQIIKEHAKQGKFDILLVFMFDRIGRIADETPFVVEWFVKNGIRVWSTQEGEQRFDSHTDKLTNYIRFWQADGESEKTSIRTKTALGQLVEDGNFKGGSAPYGYDLVKSGRVNKRKHEVFGLAVNEAEAAVVRIIFDKYVNEGFGVQRIASYLNGLGYRARTGKCWHHSSIRGMICNLTYTGVLRSGESRSDVQPHLQIIPPELYDAAQNIRTSRANVTVNERHVPMNTRGQSLLAGNVFCGHCGSRLCLTTNGKPYPCKADPNRIVKRIRYICYGKTRKQTECDGQTGYTTHVLDGIIDKVIRQIFERMKAVPKSEIVNVRYRDKMVERKALLRAVKAEHAKAAAELDMLKAEVIKSLRGESSFSQDLLSSLIAESETKCLEVQKRMEAAQVAVDEGQAVQDALNAQYNDIITWSEMYDSASIEAKKMIVNCLIKRVDVYRDYKLHIEFNIDFEQFSMGMDIAAIAA